MALSAVTPRDRLQRLADLARKTLRNWWLVAVFAVVGGGLSFGFAMLKGRQYQSWSTLFYQERIESQILAPNREEIAQRNIADKYRELLVARPQLEAIVNDPQLDPFPDEPDVDIKLDKLRNVVKLEARGGNAFRIEYTDAEPDRAKAVVERLTKNLQETDEKLRRDIADRTVEFATDLKEKAAKELHKHEQELAGFLAKHPEFAQDTQQSQEGASIRAINDPKKNPAPTGDPKLYALERQRMRIQARLDAPVNSPPIKIQQPPSAEKIAAEAQVAEAQRELAQANRELEDALSKFTDQHPTTQKAQQHVAAAQQRLRHAQAAVPPDIETVVAPATADDRVKLQKELNKLEEQISDLQKRGSKAPAVNTTTDWVVRLETEHADLRRSVAEERERTAALSTSVFRATIDASQKAAETGGRLTVVDPAFKPVRPSGPGKTIFLMAGMVLFVGLGFGLAVGLAVIDDRIYRRADLDQLGVAVLGVIPPAAHVVRRARPKAGRITTQVSRPPRKETNS